MLQVHELGYNEESLQNSHYNEDTVPECSGGHRKSQQEFNSGNAYQNEEGLPDPASIWLRNFAELGGGICYVMSHEILRLNVES